MAATSEIKVYTGTNLATSNVAANANFLSADVYSVSPASDYPINVPQSGTAYSFERVIALDFSGTFNSITNIKAWKSAGSYSDAALSLKAGTTESTFTPVQTASALATTNIPTDVGTALDLTPTAGLTAPGISKYLVMQLNVPSTVVTLGTIGTQTFTLQYDEA